MEAPRGAREPTGTNGPTPHQPPQPRHPPLQTVSAPPQRGGPPAPNTEQGPTRRGTGNQTPPTPRRAHKHGPTHGNKGGYGGAATTIRTTTNPPPTPPHGGPTRGGGRHNLVVVTAPGKRPATFRTWKLSPAAPMVLHPRGCGRVGNRHNTPRGGAAHTSAAPPRTRPRGHTPTREHAQRCAQQPPTTASYCARPPSGLRLFMFQQSSGR